MYTNTFNPNMKNNNKTYMQYISIGIELVITVIICIAIGYFTDKKIGLHTPWFTLLGALVGLTMGLYNFIKKTK